MIEAAGDSVLAFWLGHRRGVDTKNNTSFGGSELGELSHVVTVLYSVLRCLRGALPVLDIPVIAF